MNRALLLAALVLTGCLATFPENGDVYADPRLSPAIRADIKKGMGDWCAATRGGHCAVVVVGRGRYEFRLGELDHDNAGTKRRLFAVTVTLDLAAIPPSKRLTTIKHEIGHALGLHHVSYGLMRGVDTGGPWKRKVSSGCIDQRTLARVLAAQGTA